MSNLESLLNSFGVRTRKRSLFKKGKIRDTVDILNDIDKKWKKFSDDEKKVIIDVFTKIK